MQRLLRFVHAPYCLTGWLTGILVLLGVLGVPQPAKAGPWTKSPGQYYAKLSVGGYFAQGFRDASGVFQDGVRYDSVSPSRNAPAFP